MPTEGMEVATEQPCLVCGNPGTHQVKDLLNGPSQLAAAEGYVAKTDLDKVSARFQPPTPPAKPSPHPVTRWRNAGLVSLLVVLGLLPLSRQAAAAAAILPAVCFGMMAIELRRQRLETLRAEIGQIRYRRECEIWEGLKFCPWCGYVYHPAVNFVAVPEEWRLLLKEYMDKDPSTPHSA